MSTRLRLLVPALALGLIVAACGGAASPTPGGSGAPATASPSASAAPMESPTPAASVPVESSAPAAICDDAAAFRASMLTLANLKLLEVGTSGVKAAVADVKSSAEALLVSGKELLAQPVGTLIASVTALQTTLTGLGDQSGLGGTVAAVRLAIEQIKSAADDVETALGTTCPTQ